MEGHLTGSGVPLLTIHSSVLQLAHPENKAWKESWAPDEGPWSLLPLQPRPASPKLKENARICPCPHPLSVAISVSQTGWTADFMTVTVSNHGGLTGFGAPAAQSVHFGHSPFSQALAGLQ